MAEYADTPETGADGTDEQSAAKTSRFPSVGLLLAGLASLLVSVWALIGPFSLEPLANVAVYSLGSLAAGGKLGDIAPTLLPLLRLPVPVEMTGNDLLAEDGSRST